MKIFETKEFAEVKVSYSTKVKKADRVKIQCSGDCEKVFRSVYDFNGNIEHKEVFYAMFLNRCNEIIGVNKISEGGVSGTTADPSIIFQAAILVNAVGLIICHNHPSGNLMSSESDNKLTTKIKEGGKFFDINLLDHIILTADGYKSFADEGMM